MRKTKKTALTDEVRNALVELRKRKKTWESLPLAEAGYSVTNYSGVRQVLHNSMLDIRFIARLLLMLDEKRVETPSVIIEVKGKNYEALNTAAFNLKQNLAALKPSKKAWRRLAVGYGYCTTTGSFARAVVERMWAPAEMIYYLCQEFKCNKISGEHDGVNIIFTVKKKKKGSPEQQMSDHSISA